MKELHSKHALLISYADGRANPSQKVQAERFIATDPKAREFYQNLLLTALPAIEVDTNQPSVNQSLIQRINDTAMPKGAFGNPAIGDNSSDKNPATINSRGGSSLLADTETVQSGGTVKQSRKFGYAALAASVFIGAVVAGGVFTLVAKQEQLQNTVAELEIAETPEWIRLVADYHRLYVRETVLATAPSSSVTASQKISESLQHDFTVPSLDAQGLQFRRAQWLAIDEQPLLQLAYLPETGNPLAVCVLKRNTSSEVPAQYGETGGMQYVQWQTGRHAVIIVGSVSQEELSNIHEIVERDML